MGNLCSKPTPDQIKLIDEYRKKDQYKDKSESYIESQIIKNEKTNMIQALSKEFPEIYPLPEKNKVFEFTQNFTFTFELPEESYRWEIANAFLKNKKKKFVEERHKFLDEILDKDVIWWEQIQKNMSNKFFKEDEKWEDEITRLYMDRESIRANWQERHKRSEMRYWEDKEYFERRRKNKYTYIHKETPAYQIPYYQLLETKSSMLPEYAWDSTYAANEHPEEDMGYVGCLFCGIFIVAAVIKTIQKFGKSIQSCNAETK